MPINTITDEEFIEVINKLSEYESDSDNFTPISSLDQLIVETSLDSLGIMMLFMWLDTAFGISEEDGKKFFEETDVFDGHSVVAFVKKHQTTCYTKAEVDHAIRSVLT